MKVLVATKERRVFDILRDTRDVEPVFALDTGTIYEMIPSVQLGIVDYSDLVAQPYSEEFMRSLLGSLPFKVYSSSEFLASPQTLLKADAPLYGYKLPPKRTVVFTSYAGGTGKTTLALDTALRFASRTKAYLPLPTALFEFVYGGSALQALVGRGRPTLYDLVLQPEMNPGQFQGVTLYPMDYDRVKTLPVDQVMRYCRDQIANHVLTVIDTIWPAHPALLAMAREVDLWIVVTTPRIDAVENARKLHGDLALAHGDEKVIILVNKMGGLADSLALMGIKRPIEIRARSEGAKLDGEMGREVLGYVYGSLWREYERGRRARPSLLRRLKTRESKG